MEFSNKIILKVSDYKLYPMSMLFDWRLLKKIDIIIKK